MQQLEKRAMGTAKIAIFQFSVTKNCLIAFFAGALWGKVQITSLNSSFNSQDKFPFQQRENTQKRAEPHKRTPY